MARAQEEFTDKQEFLAFPPYSVRSKSAALEELQRPCSQFRSPLSREERIRLFISGKMEGMDMLSSVTEVTAPGTPLNWQSILRYLHEKGVITKPRFQFTACSNDLPKSYQLGLGTQWDERKTDGTNMKGGGFAHSRSVEIAMSKAIGEALERHFLTLYKRKAFLRSSREGMQKARLPTLDISTLNGFLPWQKSRNTRFAHSDQAPISWVRAKTAEGGIAYVPAQLVFWNYNFTHDTEEPILINPTTSGAGGYFTREGAVLSGLLENIERDGFLIYWLNGIAPKRIDVGKMQDEEIQILLGEAARYGLEMYFLDITTDIGIPSTICAIVDPRGDEPVVAIGGAAGFTAKDTLLHAGHEALAVLNFVLRHRSFSLPSGYQPFTDRNIGRTERLTMWRGKEMLERFSFFLKGKMQSPEEFLGRTPVADSARERLQYVLKRLQEMGSGYEAYVYEVKDEVLKTLGYHVVQTIVPQLVPIYLSENLPTLDSRRLREVPAKLGYKAADTLTPWPHPFP